MTSIGPPRPTALDNIPLAVPEMAGNEREYLMQCLEDNMVSSVGPFVDRFERAFADWVGAGHAVACSTGTAAIHVALQLTGAKAGATVAVSDMTFIASVNAIAYTGARPVVVDSEWRTWNLDSELLHAEIVRRAARGKPLPDVIEAVHVLGHPADLEPLLDLRRRYGIPLVEDAAEALGATYASGPFAGRHVGTIGDLGCFSFNGNKIITCGGGGMIVTDDAELARRAKHLTTTAKQPGLGYVHDEVAYNYRLTNIAAALGLAQLEQLGGFLERKREIVRRYDEGLAELPTTAPPRASWASPSFWLYSILIDGHVGISRHELLNHFANHGVHARPLWPPVHQQPPYRGVERIGGDVANALYTRGISLPSSVGLTVTDQSRVLSALRSGLES